jgi:hypothetical protein
LLNTGHALKRRGGRSDLLIRDNWRRAALQRLLRLG